MIAYGCENCDMSGREKPSVQHCSELAHSQSRRIFLFKVSHYEAKTTEIMFVNCSLFVLSNMGCRRYDGMSYTKTKYNAMQCRQ